MTTGDPFATSLDAAFDQLLEGRDLPKRSSGKSQRAEIQDAVAHIRCELALRGNTDPHELLPAGLSGFDRLEVLDLVLRDCDAGYGSGWLLNDAPRRRELERLGKTTILNLLDEGHARDDIQEAMRSVFAPSKPIDPTSLSVAQLRALLSVEPAVIGLASGYPDPGEVRRLLAYKARLEEFVRFSSAGFVGRKIELQELLEFIRGPGSSKQRIESLHLWGTGGIGKSTLIAAALASVMREADSGVVPVHLDFDRKDLAIENTIGLSLEVLRQIGTMDRDADQRLKRLRDNLRDGLKKDYEKAPGRASETAASEVLTGMRGSLAFLRQHRKRVLLVLDTFENVERSGHRALVGLRRWIEQLALVSGAPQLRVVVAGRSDPVENGIKKALSWPPRALTRKLEDLSGPESCDLLGKGGVPQSTAMAIFSSLGGNPLILLLIRRMFEATGDLEAIEQVAADLGSGKEGPQVIQGVLYDRFLKHLPSEDARTYAHPGLVLPEITPELIRNVLGPLKGERDMTVDRSEAIFDALASASWLVHKEGRSLSQRPDIRRLTLKLMMADPTRAKEVERVRMRAILHHASSTSVKDRAALAYHVLMKVKETEDIQLVYGLNFSGTGPYIRKLAEDLPEKARTFVEVLDFEGGTGGQLRAVSARSIPAEQALAQLPDELWASYIGGDDTRIGEGDRLVDHGDPLTALELWRRRPTGPDRCPPTFVLRALAETGEWNAPDADVDALVDELARQPRGPRSTNQRFHERLYWTICFSLLARPLGYARESDQFRPLISILKRHLERHQRMTSGPDLVPLTAIIEGLFEEHILPDKYFSSSSRYASCTRLHLQRGRWTARSIQWQLDLSDLVTLQKNFASTFSDSRQDVIRAGTQVVFHSTANKATSNTLLSAQAEIDALHGKPLVQVQRALKAIKRKVTVRAGGHKPADRAREVMLLRGSTPELHRPARQALVEALVENRYDAAPNRSTQERVAEFASKAFKLLSIRPAEFNVRRFASRAAVDPHSAFLSFVEFADRARVLESVLLIAQEGAINDRKISRVLAALRAWDWALVRRSADWAAGGDRSDAV